MSATVPLPLEVPDLHAAEAEARSLIWEAFGYSTNERAVDLFHASRARTKIVSCPARTSKSYAAWKDVLPDILLHGARVDFDPTVRTQVGWIVAPNYVLAKEFDYAWIDLVEKSAKVGFNFKIEKKSNNVTQGDMQIVINWGRCPAIVDGQLVRGAGDIVKDIITVKSATNINVLQGEEVDWCILSEAARLPQLVWTKFLSTRVGRSIWPTTPDIEAAWIWEEIQKASNPELGIDSFQFTGKANPGYDWERYWIEHMKTEESECGHVETRPKDTKSPPSVDNGHDCFEDTSQCKAMKEDGFAEQFGGKWIFHRGRVVPIRKQTGDNGQPAHVVDDDFDWIRHADMHVSFDYGYSDGTCIQFWFVSSVLYLYDSIYETEMVADDVVSEIRKKVKETAMKLNRDPDTLVRRYVGDPQQPQVAEVFRRRGIAIFDINKAAQRDRRAGHQEFMNALKIDPATNEPGLYIHKRNKDVIKEWMRLRRNHRVSENAPSAFFGADHAYDAARYFIMTRPIRHDLPSRKKKSEFEEARQRILSYQRKDALAKARQSYGKSRSGILL